MSYLNLPRLHFFGSFRAAPSTINNTDSNYQQVNTNNLAWNPMGAHQFQLLQGNEPGLPPGLSLAACTVQSLCINPGQYLTSPSQDALVGGLVVSTNNPVPGRLVDLDPDQQGVSMVFGMQLGIGDPSGEWVVGNFEATCFRQMWRRIATSRPTSSYWFSALYQSILTDLQWPSNITSPFLQALFAASPYQLSIKFNVDLHNPNTPTPDEPNPMFTIGRVAGTIGPVLSGEPVHYVLGRRMFPQVGVVLGSGATTSAPITATEMARLKSGRAPQAADAAGPGLESNPGVPLNPAPFIVDTTNSRLVVDLGNSLPNDDFGNSLDLGTLQVLAAGSSAPIFTVDNALSNYQQKAYIYDFALTPAQLNTLSNTALQIVQVGQGTVLAEASDGACFDADEYVYRQQPNTTAPVTFQAAFFGQPSPDAHNITILLPVQTFAGSSSTDITFSATTLPLNSGTVTVIMNAGAPNPPRPFIDGQVYQVSYGLDGEQNPDPNAFLSVLTHAEVPIPANPTWTDDVQPILSQYADLYPFMANIINLGDEQSVIQAKDAIIERLTMPMTDPRFMPVVRDLSDAKRTIIINWLNSVPTTAGQGKSGGHGGGPVS